MLKCSANTPLLIKLWNRIKKKVYIYVKHREDGNDSLQLTKCYFGSAGKPT